MTVMSYPCGIGMQFGRLWTKEFTLYWLPDGSINRRCFRPTNIELRDPLVVCNGALVKERRGVVWRSDRLDLSLTRKLLKFAELHEVYAKVYVEDLLLVKEDNEEARNFVKTHRIDYQIVGELSLNIAAEPDLIVFKAQSEAIPKLARQIQTEFGADVSLTQSFPTSLEIMAARVSKREALHWLANRLAVPREAVLAIGNSLNDLEMLEWAGQGIAMANSDSLLKASWPDLSEYNNNHNGVAAILEQYVFGEIRKIRNEAREIMQRKYLMLR
jgi:Cof subfamily protein (haloacid dehalogenase superfamily)